MAIADSGFGAVAVLAASDPNWFYSTLAPSTAAIVARTEDDPPERPHRFTIVDENGVEREASAPPGYVTRWPW